MGGARISLVVMASAILHLFAQHAQAVLTISGRIVVNWIGEAAHLAFLDDQRFLIVRDVLSDIANQIVILAARFNVLAKLAVFLASAFSVVVWTQCLLAGNFFELFNHKTILLKNSVRACGFSVFVRWRISDNSAFPDRHILRQGKYSAQHGAPQQHGNSPHYTGG